MGQVLPIDRPKKPRRDDRAGLFMAAMLRHRGQDCTVIVRDISRRGAMVEADCLPGPGTAVELVRADLRVVASVAWANEGRAGLEFSEAINLARWAPGLRHREQMDVDRKLDEARKAMADDEPEVAPRHQCGGKLLPDAVLDRRIGEELGMLSRRVDRALQSLSTFAPVIARHPHDLQALEYVEQMLGHFERVLAAEDRCAAVEQLGQEDVRRRLLR